MSNHDNEFKLTITQDKLVDILMHAATREDIAKLDTKVDTTATRLDAKIDTLEAKLDAKIDTLEAKMDHRFDKLESKYDRIIWGIVLAILVPVAVQLLIRFI